MDVLKTIKMFAGGAFIRSESGATVPYIVEGEELARVCVASKKDFRNAVTSAKAAQSVWAEKSSYNRSQILYRMAEMTQGRETELMNLMMASELVEEANVAEEVQKAVDTFVYYAGWCDKYQQVMGGLNPVAGPYHNFTAPEAVGVVSLVTSEKFNLSQIVDNICSIICGGNSVVALLSPESSIFVSILGEIFHTSDLPGGIVNLLSGKIEDLATVMAEHMEVNSISFQNENETIYFDMRSRSIDNMKRIIGLNQNSRSLELITAFVEQKTVWHPIGV